MSILATGIYYRLKGEQVFRGPFAEEEVLEWYRSGWFTATTAFRFGDDDGVVTLGELCYKNGNACPFRSKNEQIETPAEWYDAQRRKMQEQIDTTNRLLQASVERCTKLKQIVSTVVERFLLFSGELTDVKEEWESIRHTPLVTDASPSVTSSTTTLASGAPSSSTLNLLMQLKDDMNALEHVLRGGKDHDEESRRGESRVDKGGEEDRRGERGDRGGGDILADMLCMSSPRSISSRDGGGLSDDVTMMETVKDERASPVKPLLPYPICPTTVHLPPLVLRPARPVITLTEAERAFKFTDTSGRANERTLSTLSGAASVLSQMKILDDDNESEEEEVPKPWLDQRGSYQPNSIYAGMETPTDEQLSFVDGADSGEEQEEQNDGVDEWKEQAAVKTNEYKIEPPARPSFPRQSQQHQQRAGGVPNRQPAQQGFARFGVMGMMSGGGGRGNPRLPSPQSVLVAVAHQEEKQRSAHLAARGNLSGAGPEAKTDDNNNAPPIDQWPRSDDRKEVKTVSPAPPSFPITKLPMIWGLPREKWDQAEMIEVKRPKTTVDTVLPERKDPLPTPDLNTKMFVRKPPTFEHSKLQYLGRRNE